MSSLEVGLKQRAELGNLLGKVGEYHYKRIKLAKSLLENVEWVDAPNGGGGDLNSAIDRLERDCFGDLCGNVGLCQLLDLINNYPDDREWAQHGYRFREMWAEWKSKQKPEKSKKKQTERRVVEHRLPSVAEYNQYTPSEQRRSYEKSTRVVETLEQKCSRLETENAHLREENTKLKEELQGWKNWLKSRTA